MQHVSMTSVGALPHRRFPVPTPPPSGSPVELAPILDMTTLTEHRPPSPSSPTKTASVVANDLQTRKPPQPPQPPIMSSSSYPPAFLEPRPILDFLPATIPPQLFHTLSPTLLSGTDKRKRASLHKIPSLQIPVSYSMRPPDYRHPPSQTEVMPIKDAEELKCRAEHSPSMSPTMTAAAIAAAAAAASQKHPGSTLPSTFFGRSVVQSPGKDDCDVDCIGTDALSHATTASASVATRQRAQTERPGAPLHPSFVAHKKHQSIDQNMFLTKNAHIKRPRNAWIHFRCHYGQALKAQDPTLRAEEISKRASRRWSKLAEAEKKPWHELAEHEKQAHKEAFPEYRYCPKRSSTSVPSTPSTTSGPYRLSDFDETEDRTQKRVKRSRTK